MSQGRRILTTEQIKLVQELGEAHGLDISQISFEGEDANPIFDYEAVCALSLKLTDIQDISCQISERDLESGVVSASCKITLPDGRTRTVEDSAVVNDVFSDGKIIETMRLAENVAQARAVRRGIRSVGINLFNAHKKWMLNPVPATATVDHDPRYPIYQEIHLLAAKLGFIKGQNKTAYQNYIAECFEGRTSSVELDDVELQRLLRCFRGFARLEQFQPAQVAAAQKAA